MGIIRAHLSRLLGLKKKKKKACHITEDNLTLWSYGCVLVAFHCWKRLQSSIINLSSLIITLMLIPPPHILLLHHHHIKGFRDQHSGLSRCWIGLVSGPTMLRGVSVRKRPDLIRDRAPRLPLTNNSNCCYRAALIRPLQHYLTQHQIPSFSHYLQWMWQQKIATKAESASDINHWNGAPLIRAIWLKVKEQRAPLTRHWAKWG